MQEQISKYLKDSRLQNLTDTRVLGLIAFGVIAILVSWSGIKSIQTNYELQKQISVETQKNEVQKLENENLKLRNEYYKTEEFLELAARRQFGLAAPGETVYVVPREVAISNIVEEKVTKPKTQAVESDKPAYQQNLEAWEKFLLNGRDEKSEE